MLKKQVKADDTIDISWINEDLITFVKDRLGHDQRYAIDPTKITNALGWYPETKFEVGIVKTIEWYLNNQPWVEEVTSGEKLNSILGETSRNMLFLGLLLAVALN